ncbi:MAG TPA: hypothetical protein VMS32_09495 [Verrucomicrobiae bacterium]|jgi:hypothetical protein|nr:hypothetical protein [Verrucomicrobiae bacterium]
MIRAASAIAILALLGASNGAPPFPIVLPQRLAGLHLIASRVNDYSYTATYADGTRIFVAAGSEAAEDTAGTVFATARTAPLGTVKLVADGACLSTSGAELGGASGPQYEFDACGMSRTAFRDAVASLGRAARVERAVASNAPLLRGLSTRIRAALRATGVPALLPSYLPPSYRLREVNTSCGEGYCLTFSDGRGEIEIDGSSGGWGGEEEKSRATVDVSSPIFGRFEMDSFDDPTAFSHQDILQVGNAGLGYQFSSKRVTPRDLKRVLESLAFGGF